MRTFIAVELPRGIKDRLAELQALLKKSGADVKWAAPHNIHLTLKFLGEVDEEKLPGIIEAMESACENKKTFTATLSTCGAFPKIEFPRVIWVSLARGDQEVKALAQALEEILEKTGIPREERPFSSHITIARVRSPRNKDMLVKALKETENYFSGKNLGFEVDAITLFKSTLGPGGPDYEALKKVSITPA